MSKTKLDRLERYFKVGKTSAAPVSFRLLQYFIDKEEVVLEPNLRLNRRPRPLTPN